MKKLVAFSAVLFLFVLLSGCSSLSVLTGGYKPLIVEWPTIKQQTNVPAMNQGILVTAPRDAWLNITKTSGYGTTAIVLGMPPGGEFFFPADNNLQYTSTVIVTVRGYDEKGNFIGVISRSFTFSNYAGYSYNQYWNVSRADLR